MSPVKHTVLIAEDNPGLARVFAFKFEKCGFRPIVCSDGQHALQEFYANSVDAIVTDQEMPHLSGLELIATVRDNDLAVPCFLVTGRQLELARDPRITALNILHVFGKPFSPAKVVAAVDRAINERNLNGNASAGPAAETAAILPVSPTSASDIASASRIDP